MRLQGLLLQLYLTDETKFLLKQSVKDHIFAGMVYVHFIVTTINSIATSIYLWKVGPTVKSRGRGAR